MAKLTKEIIEEERLLNESIAEEERLLVESIAIDEQSNADLAELSPAGLEIEANALEADLFRDSVLSPTDYNPLVTDQEQFEADEQLMNLAEDKRLQDLTPIDLNRFNDELTRDPDIIKADKGIDRHGFIDTFKELKTLDGIVKRAPILGPVYKSGRIMHLIQSVEVLNGERKTIGDTKHRHIPGASISLRPVTNADKIAAQKFVNKWMEDMIVAQNRTLGGKFANVALELPAFIIEFMLTGPIFKTGNLAAQKTATKLLGRYAENATGKLAVRVAGLGFGSLGRTTVNMPRILAGTFEGQIEGGLSITEDGALVFADAERSPFSSLARSFTGLYIENLSEVTGKSLKEGAKFIGIGIGKKFPVIPKFTAALAEKWMSNGVGRTLKKFASVSSTRLGFDGIIEEIGEERVRDILALATGLETFEDIAPTWEKMWIEAGILTTFGGVNLAVNKGFRGDFFRNEPTKENILRPTEGQPLNLSERLDSVPLFQSAKNTALVEKEMAEALDFINERIGNELGPFDSVFPKVIKSDDDVPDFAADIAADKAKAEGEVKTFRGGTKGITPTVEAASDTAQFGSGVYFGPEGVAEEFASERPDGEIQEFTINTSNFFDERTMDLDTPEGRKVADALIEAGAGKEFVEANFGGVGSLSFIGKVFAKKGEFGFSGSAEIKKAVQDAGFDGVISEYQGAEQYAAYTNESFTSTQAQEAKAEQDMKIVTVSTKSKAINGNFEEATVDKPASPLKRAVVRNIARAEDAVGTWGKTGKKIQKDLREISYRTAVNTGNTVQNIKPWTKGLSKAEKVTVAQLIDGAIARDNQPDRLIIRADAIRKELDVIQEQAQEIGLRQNDLTGRAFPQILNKEGKAEIESWEVDGPKSGAMYARAQQFVQEGKFDTVQEAIIAMEQYRQGIMSGKQGYVEGTRTLDIGNEFRDWNLDKILSGTIESAWEKIEAGRQWGVLKESKTDSGNMLLPFRDVTEDIMKLRLDVGHNEANALNEYLKAQYGLSGADTALVKVARVARTTQFVGKLAFSPLTISRNILDRYSKGLSHGTLLTNARAGAKYPPFLNNWMKSARNIEDQMIRAGAVLGHGHLSEGFSGTEGVISLIAKPFASSEKGNQTYIALVKKLQLESDVKRLMELDGREGKVSKAFDTMATIVGQSQKQTRNRVLTNLSNEQLADAMSNKGQISPDVMAEVLHRTTTDSAFPLTLASKRLWWGNKPVMQAATQFKVWSADQTRFIYKDVIKYGTQTGDWSRLARFMLGTWVMGELYNISRDFMVNKDESLLSKAKGGTKEEMMMSIGKDLIDGGVVGFLSDFTYGIGDWAAGPTVSSISGFTKAIDQSKGTASLPEALGKFALKDIPALRQVQGVMDRIDRNFYDEENNLTENYARWQGRSYDFRLKNGESSGSILKDRIMRSVRGVPTQKVGKRSLSLNMIARQVLVGDHGDAAQHIKRVMRQTEPKDLDGAVQAFDQSMLNNSPIGNIGKKNLALFLGQFSPEEVADVLELQQKWITGYQTSLKKAFDELEKEGFEEDMQKKADKYVEELQPKIDEAMKVIEEAEKILEERK